MWVSIDHLFTLNRIEISAVINIYFCESLLSLSPVAISNNTDSAIALGKSCSQHQFHRLSPLINGV